jgi:hypothetical protein
VILTGFVSTPLGCSAPDQQGEERQFSHCFDRQCAVLKKTHYAQPSSFRARPAFQIFVMCAILLPSNCIT